MELGFASTLLMAALPLVFLRSAGIVVKKASCRRCRASVSGRSTRAWSWAGMR
jgi:hypothetical protein